MRSNLFVVMWANSSEGGRPFETFTRNKSGVPVAFRFSFLESKFAPLIAHSQLVVSEAQLKSLTEGDKLSLYTKDNPLLVSTEVAKAVFGWKKFDVWEESGG